MFFTLLGLFFTFIDAILAFFDVIIQFCNVFLLFCNVIIAFYNVILTFCNVNGAVSKPFWGFLGVVGRGCFGRDAQSVSLPPPDHRPGLLPAAALRLLRIH